MQRRADLTAVPPESEQLAQTGAPFGAYADLEAEPRLLDAAIDGDDAAFAGLYDLHLTRVYRHVFYRVGNRADAEDLTQQVFLQAWRAIARYQRTGAPFIAWLLTIAHNLIVSFYRQAKDRPALDLDPVAAERWSNPEHEVLAEYDRLAVRAAVLRLKPEQQHVVTMRFLENFDYATIAGALGKSEGNVRVIQHRALNELRRLLRQEVAG
ncbi:MAG TPA: sigma-70 family RNA polymerase sigma factor [Dehalococcoidia bacterium]|nr:sigma-70 family RNA polymerase sigma factor [Dehalococcoidia bacterium]